MCNENADHNNNKRLNVGYISCVIKITTTTL